MFWEELQAQSLGQAPEEEPYRYYVLGLWNHHRQDWGAPPE